MIPHKEEKITDELSVDFVPAYFDDFERWCEECVIISDKLSGAPIPFHLNAPQRRLAHLMESQRRAGKPVRVILLKARQWGGSTLVQAYIAWHQLVRNKGRNALVCAHVKDAAALIRSTYSMLLDMYPQHMKPGEVQDWKLKPFQQTQGTLWIPARQARLAITSANNPDGLRGASYHLAHLSEAAFWGDGDVGKASAIVRTVCGTVPAEKDTVVVIESTANGTDNWFANEWQRAVAGKSDKTPMFVPWYEIEIYRLPLAEEERRELMESLDDYELRLMAQGVSLEALAWYKAKRREYATHAEMMAEFPSTAQEAFATSSQSPFSPSMTAHLNDPIPLLEKSGRELLVAVTADKLSLQEFTVSDRRLVMMAEQECASLSALMSLSAQRHRATGAPVLVVEGGNGRHGRWCARYARRHSVPICYVGDSEVLIVTPDMLGVLTDTTVHLLERDRLRDTNPSASEMYRLFDMTHPWRSAAVLGRLAAAYQLEYRLEGSKPSPSDFFN